MLTVVCVFVAIVWTIATVSLVWLRHNAPHVYHSIPSQRHGHHHRHHR